EGGDKRAATLLKGALSTDEGGGLATLSAACFSREASLAAPLAKLAGCRHAHLAFGADVAGRIERRASFDARTEDQREPSHRALRRDLPAFDARAVAAPADRRRPR